MIWTLPPAEKGTAPLCAPGPAESSSLRLRFSDYASRLVLRKPACGFVLFLVVFLVYFFSWSPGIDDAKWSGDSKWTVYTAMSLLREGNTDLNEYRRLVGRDYAAEPVNGRLYHSFPLGSALLSLPLVLATDQFSSHILKIDLNQQLGRELPLKMEHYFAALFAALTAVVIFLIGGLFIAHPGRLLLLVTIFAFGTSAWSTASHALWSHGPSMLMLALALYLLLLAPRRPWLAALAGPPLAFAYLTRPTNSISFLLLSIFMLLRYRKYLLLFLLGAATVLVPFFLYNLALYGSPLSNYYRPQRLGQNPFFWEALAGNLISPGRGLFIFSPVLLLALLGLAIKIKERRFSALDAALAAIILTHWCAVSAFPHWWAGWSFGPRFFSDMIPVFIYFTIPVLQHLPPPRQMKAAAALAGILLLTGASIFVHFQGATNRETLKWNETPRNIDKSWERLWDWQDLQFLR